jgi:cation:H+ antiporter
MIIEISIFIASCFILSLLSSKLIKTLTEVARYLRWREFIIAFFVMGFAASLPNLFVDLNAALRGMQQIAFGDIMGGNLVDLSLGMAIAVLLSRKYVSTESKMVQSTAIFTIIIAFLPWILILRTGGLDRLDGVILISSFFAYAFWLFSRDDRFKKVYENKKLKNITKKSTFIWNIIKIILILATLLASSYAVVYTAQYFASTLDVSLGLVGVLIVALGNCFPEIYFGVISARKEKNWMVLGDMMASVIVCATLVLGIVALVAPFKITDFSPFFIARIFMVVSCVLYLLFINSDKKITKKEGLLLLSVYTIFLLTEIFFPIR